MADGKSRDEHLAEVERQAHKAERSATWAVRGSGCALILMAIPIVLGVAAAIWVALLVAR
ncbi:MAG TPA: hypothetical protein VG276_27865 [Actinomycetes bacterium]|jgi:uncharacterized protein HemX|nr:hypothetical protein [Actinomycetes bacterium]